MTQTAIDLTPLINYLLALVLAILVPSIPLVTAWIFKRFKIANAAALQTQIDSVATAAAGVAYNYGLAHEGGFTRLDVHDAAVAKGITYLSSSLPAALAAAGATDQKVADLVTSRLGVLLASDPTVSAGSPAKVPAPAQAPPPAAGLTAGVPQAVNPLVAAPATAVLALALSLGLLGACSSPAATSTTVASAVLTAADDAQAAAYGAEDLYVVTAKAATAAAPLLPAAARAQLRAADAKAYALVLKLRTEAQAGAIVQADITSATAALAGLATFSKGATP